MSDIESILCRMQEDDGKRIGCEIEKDADCIRRSLARLDIMLDEYSFRPTERLAENIIKRAKDINAKALFFARKVSEVTSRAVDFLDEEETSAAEGINVEISGSKECGFTLAAPPLFIRPKKIWENGSKLIGAAIRKSLLTFCENSGLDTPVYEKAEVRISLMAGDDRPYKVTFPDADNLDVKAALDSLCDVLINDDNLGQLTLVVRGEKVEGCSYTKIEVFPG